MNDDLLSPITESTDPELARKRRLDFISKLMFQTPGGARFTQDSPVLTNVWLNYALNPRAPQKLILTVNHRESAGKAAKDLRSMLTEFRKRLGREETGYQLLVPIKERETKRPNISYISGQMSVELYFDELMRVVLPLTPWWHEIFGRLIAMDKKLGALKDAPPESKTTSTWRRFPIPTDHKKDLKDGSEKGYAQTRFDTLLDALLDMRTNIDADLGLPETDLRRALGLPAINSNQLANNPRAISLRLMPTSLVWLIRIAGTISKAFSDDYELLSQHDDIGLRLEREFKNRDLRRQRTIRDQIDAESGEVDRLASQANRIKKTRKAILSSFLGIYQNWSDEEIPKPPEPKIWRATRNRPIHLAVQKSSLTVKADAATRLFDISCKDVTWAVIDSGIDGNHPALQDPLTGKSRVTKTFDFTKIREMLNFDLISQKGGADDSGKAVYADLVETIARRLKASGDYSTLRSARTEARRRLTRLTQRISKGQDIDWEDLLPILLDDDPETPSNDHGTHVAGILAADWLEHEPTDGERDPETIAKIPRRLRGICPDIKLYDIRVFRSDGRTDEFELLAAVQFLRWLNARAGYMEVQGANLSLSLIHEVRRFACGRTPICEECNEASALGMVMVAAAGNFGYEAGDIDELTFEDGFRNASITDPGNADNVITVGSTHRKRPYDYGVSYFSSRGPTGDGRQKPDLVAPGEKIKSITPNEGLEYKDGTSMAAPHVSGAAALLMARNRELIGKPQKVKEILCNSASDLGREKYFQGNGLVDVLRALQSV